MSDIFMKVGFVVLILGSLVDLAQAAWIVKRQYRRWKRGMYERAKREVLLREFEREKGRDVI